ncbi:Hypothetical Protein FCC1311_094672 [Hondaea fermentalgiana]|uniref:Uncharacterized protein n=1 Tax=Hondaea fermentalgiana TaxID=2315210 RepID=A0A2R5GX33_9STRA|nr:Hypothetical Protein FCC1311_094672 [Hondaea fermentalgiana]|eukprot:GBG33243.1 Hypothetical Protein FCC1311_094672 [Hondaea fermentalgiana]
MKSCVPSAEESARTLETKHEEQRIKSEMDDASSSEGGSDSGSDTSNEGGSDSSKGRFSDVEKAILFDIIRQDGRILHEFLHQTKARTHGGKGWMHEIGDRFNQRAPNKRRLDAVRHHLLLRKSSSGLQDEFSQVHHLLNHAVYCGRRDTCTKCLLLDRYRVQQGLARCGLPKCIACDESLPHVNDVYDAEALRLQISTRLAARRDSPRALHEPKQQSQPQQYPPQPHVSPTQSPRTRHLFGFPSTSLPISQTGPSFAMPGMSVESEKQYQHQQPSHFSGIPRPLFAATPGVSAQYPENNMGFALGLHPTHSLRLLQQMSLAKQGPPPMLATPASVPSIPKRPAKRSADFISASPGPTTFSKSAELPLSLRLALLQQLNSSIEGSFPTSKWTPTSTFEDHCSQAAPLRKRACLEKFCVPGPATSLEALARQLSRPLTTTL